MSVYYCVPAKRPLAESTLPMWRERGYRVAAWLDDSNDGGLLGACNLVMPDFIRDSKPYPGYASAVNILVLEVLRSDPRCEWIVTGGDDVLPDPNHTPEEIARECSEYFGGQEGQVIGVGGSMTERASWYRTFGVMQPTGDRWGDHEPHLGQPGSSYIDRVCGSPWMGREWCLRINQGHGPLWPEYYHMGEDEELQAVSTKLGVLWQRRDLTHYHRHWARARKDASDMPEFLKRANSGEHWREYKKLLGERQAAGFPGSEPL